MKLKRIIARWKIVYYMIISKLFFKKSFEDVFMNHVFMYYSNELIMMKSEYLKKKHNYKGFITINNTKDKVKVEIIDERKDL